MPKVFGIGLFKTGTTSLAAAFRTLKLLTDGQYWPLFNGLPPLFDLSGQPFEPYHQEIYHRALQSQAFSDSPWLFLYKELDQWFPGSKFILTLRSDSDALARSELNMWNRGWLSPAWQRQTDLQPTLEMFKQRYADHNRLVREYFADKNSLLEICFETEQEPWPKLCDFLEVEAYPRTKFPHENKGTYD